jgi:hypothetical protein
MFGSHNDGVDKSQSVFPPAAHGSISGTRMLMGLLLLLIAVAAVMGIAVSLSSGQPTVAFIIGLVAVAFFSRIGC